MKKFELFFIFVVFFLTPPILAQDNEPIITPIEEGERAPFSGTLLNPEAVAEIITQRMTDIAECELRAQHNLDLSEANCNLIVGNLEIELESTRERYESILELREQEIVEMTQIIEDEENSIFGTWWFWLGGGIILGTVTTVTIFCVID